MNSFTFFSIELLNSKLFLFFSAFLGKIKAAFETDPSLSNLLLDDFFKNAIESCQSGWRNVIAQTALLGIPSPAFSCALAFYDGYRTAKLPANLIQVSFLCYFVDWIDLPALGITVVVFLITPSPSSVSFSFLLSSFSSPLLLLFFLFSFSSSSSLPFFLFLILLVPSSLLLIYLLLFLLLLPKSRQLTLK